MNEWLEILKTLGPAAGLIVFFVWRDYTREKRMSSRLDLLEDFQKNELKELAINCVATMRDNTEVTKSFVYELRRRPCLKEEVIR